MPEPELLKEFLGDPSSRIKAPTVAQEILFGARGRCFQLQEYLKRHKGDILPDDLRNLRTFVAERSDDIEPDNAGALIADTLEWVPEELQD